MSKLVWKSSPNTKSLSALSAVLFSSVHLRDHDWYLQLKRAFLCLTIRSSPAFISSLPRLTMHCTNYLEKYIVPIVNSKQPKTYSLGTSIGISRRWSLENLNWNPTGDQSGHDLSSVGNATSLPRPLPGLGGGAASHSKGPGKEVALLDSWDME